MTTVYLRVVANGSLVPADADSRDALAARRFRTGMLLRADVVRADDSRLYWQWKKAHQLGTYLTHNLDEFDRFLDARTNRANAHGALKHLQFLAGVECDDTVIVMPDGTRMTHRAPRSLAYERMGQEQFEHVYAELCQYVIRRWWPTMEQWQIEQGASLVGLAA